MKFHVLSAAVFSMLATASLAAAQERTPWQQHNGEGIIPFGSTSPSHGAVSEYSFATVPDAAAGWFPAPNEKTIGYSIPSSLCGVASCRAAANFTYFQTFVDIPANFSLTSFSVSVSGIDDGARVSIYNSIYPNGLVVQGSYVFLGGSGTANLAQFVAKGERNRVVITHVDDCCSTSFINFADVVVNGTKVSSCSSGDSDNDTICDAQDNCPTISNVDQADADGNDLGNVCEERCVLVQEGSIGHAEDTFLDASSPATAHGMDDLLLVSGSSRAHVRFDLTSVPPDAVPTRALLSVFQDAPSNTPSVTVHKALTSVDPATTTFLTAGTFTPSPVGAFAPLADGYGFRDVDVSATVLEWLNGVSPNHGFALTGSDSAEPVEIRSSEAADSVADRPRLLICYMP